MTTDDTDCFADIPYLDADFKAKLHKVAAWIVAGEIDKAEHEDEEEARQRVAARTLPLGQINPFELRTSMQRMNWFDNALDTALNEALEEFEKKKNVGTRGENLSLIHI